MEGLRERCECGCSRDICSTCGEEKCHSEFPHDSKNRSGRAGWCKECRRAYAREYQRNNPEKARAAAARRRARLKTADAEDVDVLILYIRDWGTCGICGYAVDPVTMHLEHSVPLSRGGTHTYANCTIAHPDCNLWKGSRLPEELGVAHDEVVTYQSESEAERALAFIVALAKGEGFGGKVIHLPPQGDSAAFQVMWSGAGGQTLLNTVLVYPIDDPYVQQ